MTSFSNLLIIGFIASSIAVDNGLGRTPQMGWNPWNKYGCEINEDLVKQTADSLVESGLLAAGYDHLNLDDCWQKSRDNVTNRIQVDPNTFPSGMESLVQYVHSKGLKFGLYSDAGFLTCEGRPGSLGFEDIDALQYSEWDIDYLKYDNCHHDGTSPKVRFPPMARALLAQKKRIFFSMCEWGFKSPHLWAGQYANSWRTTLDISDNWNSFISKQLYIYIGILEKQSGLESYAGPGGWNDPDMLEVGNGGMTTIEYQSHFALWSLLKAPLIIGCDINNMSDDTKNILFNKEVIAVNQDSLGKQGSRVQLRLFSDVWAVQVQDNGEGVVVILFNRSSMMQIITIDFKSLDIKATTVYVRDLINKKDLGFATNQISEKIPSHGCVMYKLTIPSQVVK